MFLSPLKEIVNEITHDLPKIFNESKFFRKSEFQEKIESRFCLELSEISFQIVLKCLCYENEILIKEEGGKNGQIIAYKKQIKDSNEIDRLITINQMESSLSSMQASMTEMESEISHQDIKIRDFLQSGRREEARSILECKKIMEKRLMEFHKKRVILQDAVYSVKHAGDDKEFVDLLRKANSLQENLKV